VSDNIKDLNLELLIGLKQHLDHAAELRTRFERLLELVKDQSTPPKHRARQSVTGKEGRRDE
jgi:hypothetical protein